MANGSKETDSESTDEEGAGDDNGEEEDDKNGLTLKLIVADRAGE